MHSSSLTVCAGFATLSTSKVSSVWPLQAGNRAIHQRGCSTGGDQTPVASSCTPLHYCHRHPSAMNTNNVVSFTGATQMYPAPQHTHANPTQPLPATTVSAHHLRLPPCTFDVDTSALPQPHLGSSASCFYQRFAPTSPGQFSIVLLLSVLLRRARST